jgi:hypothetical protein
MDGQTWIEIFKFAPAIAALLFVIYLLYKIIVKKDETIKDLVKLSEADIARQAKIITLLEILINKGR